MRPMRALRLALVMQSAFCLYDVGKPTPPNPRKFLIISAPRFSTVSYMKLPSRVSQIPNPDQLEAHSVEVLINTTLVHPQGLAVQQQLKKLIIADPDSRKIFSYPLHSHENTLSVGKRSVIADDVESRWVAVDGIGDIFFTDEARNQILKVSHAKVLQGEVKPEVVYDGASLIQVSAPGGVAIDNFHTYWVNKLIGTQVGSVVMGSAQIGTTNFVDSVQILAKNTDKSYGICFAWNNVFFTQPSKTMYGMKKGGSIAVPITNQLTNPRGCAWDGDGTVYVADRGANAVYSFAGNMQEISAVQLSKAVELEDAFGLSIYSAASRHWPRLYRIALGHAALHILIVIAAAHGTLV